MIAIHSGSNVTEHKKGISSGWCLKDRQMGGGLERKRLLSTRLGRPSSSLFLFSFLTCGLSASLMAFSREVWLRQGSSLFHEIQVLCHVLKKTILQHGPFVLLCLAPQECLGSVPFLLDAIFCPSLPLDLLGYTCMHIKQFSLGEVDRTERHV